MSSDRVNLRQVLGANIRNYRTQLGLSQSLLGEAVRQRQQAISDIECGRQAIPSDELPLYASALKLESILPLFQGFR